jgi:chemotaxis protein methyltransferase CheR
MDAEVYSQVKISIKKLFNIDLNHYKDEQMKRRLDSWLARSRAQNWAEYLHDLNGNTTEQNRFRDYLTINVTEFFRDPDRWENLRKNVLPGLLKEASYSVTGKKGLRVWSAGCSIGVEAYTLAMLLDEEASHYAHYLLATDLDHGALQKATARGPYGQEETRNLSAEQINKYMTKTDKGYFIKENLAQRVTFRQQDMLNDRFESNFDLIVCRNVVIYFTAEAKQMLYSKFCAALRPGGILFMGGTEIMPHPNELGFRNSGISLYTKI